VRNKEYDGGEYMVHENMYLLLDDRLAPITSSMGFIEGEYSIVAEKFIEWLEEIRKTDRYTKNIRARNVMGSLEQIIQSLLPLKMIQSNRYLFIPTIGGWTAFFDNGYRGTDPTAIGHLPELLHRRSVWVVAIPHTHQLTGMPWRGRPGALVMEVYGHEQMEWLNLIRKIRLVNNAGKWEFELGGKALPFEETGRYQANRVQDRFDFDMLKRYLKAFSLSPFDEDFYLPPYNRSAILVEISTRHPERNKDVTLEEARRLNGIEN
jgi:hypothetical protein